MDIGSLLASAKDAVSVSRVFGEPIECDGTVIIPVAMVVGGGGSGRRSGQPSGEGAVECGGGFGMWGHPVGVFVIRDDRVRFRPAIDVVPLALGVSLVAPQVLRAVIRRRRRR